MPGAAVGGIVLHPNHPHRIKRRDHLGHIGVVVPQGVRRALVIEVVDGRDNRMSEKIRLFSQDRGLADVHHNHELVAHLIDRAPNGPKTSMMRSRDGQLYGRTHHDRDANGNGYTVPLSRWIEYGRCQRHRS